MPDKSETPLSVSRMVGQIRIHTVEAGRQRLDGGAMFGVVPKPLWERRIPADERNRIPLAMRCLLIEAPQALILVDTGLGNKESEKFHEIYGVENAGEPTQLEDAIRSTGFSPDDIDIVVNTHLHFDHAGGNTTRRDDGAVVPAFTRASYQVQADELAFARLDNLRTRASYLPPNFEPVVEAGLYQGLQGDVEVSEGVSVRRTPGHTPHHQSVLVRSQGETCCYLADVCPTTAHVPLPWIMGYDLEPLVTLETKQLLWQDAVRENWLLMFEHDPTIAFARLRAEDDRLTVVPEV